MARDKSGKTQAQIANEARVTERMYQDYEYDKSEPRVRTAIRIAEALGVQSFEDFKKLFGAATPIQKKPDGNRAEESHENDNTKKDKSIV